MMTAIAVQMMNRGTRFSIRVVPLGCRGCQLRRKELQVLGGAILRGGFVIGLAPGIIGSAELILLLIEDFAATIDPVIGLGPCGTRAIGHIFPAFFGLGE